MSQRQARTIRVQFFAGAVGVAAWLGVASFVSAADTLQFNRDIRPILSDTCFKCHGFDRRARKADLRLDIREGAVTARKNGTPIVPGHPEQSDVYRRLTAAAGSDELMPPAKAHLVVSPQQIETIKNWISQGAVYQPHWAFIRPQEPALPVVKNAGWVRNPIDAFLLERLEREGLSPSPEADKRTLIRRVTFDLTGLPPTPDEVNAFLADASADAYDKLVDRLMASPHYGERMVIEWLDAARYSDTNGYQGDPTRTVWPWRDWVIKSMNDNLPFDQFTIDQIAGDLLPAATQQQRLATCFNRNHTFNGEGGRISEETRVENTLDRVDTTATTFLALTLGCAKCHDHKFDPVSQKEYYQLYAYFNQCSETGDHVYVQGGTPVPVMNVDTAEQEQKLAGLKQAVTLAQTQLDSSLPQIDAAQAQWEKTLASVAAAPVGWSIATPASMNSQSGASMMQLDDGSVLVSGLNPLKDVHEVVLRTDLTGLGALRVEALPHPSLSQGGPGRSEDSGNFVLTTLEAEAVSLTDPKQTKKITFNSAEATYAQGGFAPGGAIDTDPNSGWAVWQAPDKNNVSATFGFSEPVGFAGGTEIRLKFHYESGYKQHTMGRFRLALTTGPIVPPAVTSALAVASDHRNDAQRQQIRDFYRTVSPEYKLLSGALAAAKKAETDFDNALVKAPVMDDAKPRETHVLFRGLYDKPADKVDPGTPAALNSLPGGGPNNRLALARWLVDPANPLTARVIVNRYWQSFFGTGIVKTSDDFGTQGEPPSHPELLDWLAVRFVQGGWNVKSIHRLIVTSAAYRQSSRVTPELLERDPANRLLARGPRFRMTSFQIRDQALAASGLLVDKLGGPPVKPYQPVGLWEDMSLGQISYTADKGESLYRRSVYTFWRRTVAPSTMFDVSPRTVCMVRPVRTNTPLQALALLNDPTYVEAARVLSETLLKDKMTSPEQKIGTLFQRLMSRPETEAERQVLLGALARLRTQYAADPQAAAKLVNVGEKKRDESLDVQELASWTALTNTVMNLDEVITKE